MFRILLFISTFLFLCGCNSTYNPDPAREGWVKMTFDIDEKGQPINILVVDSKPVGIFDKEAMRALKSWKYEPNIVDGTPVVQTGKEVKLDFTLADES